MSESGGSEEGAEDKRKPLVHLYLDDTGTRHIDKGGATANLHPRWFALGGILVNAEDIGECKRQFAELFERWPTMREPLHLSDMRSEKAHFSWLGRVDDATRSAFWYDYRRFLTNLPVLGAACVIDRPGYFARGYGSREGDAKWLLCRSAFDIVVERAAKYADLNGRRLKVFYEGCNREVDERLEGYFANLRGKGLEFHAERSSKYGPLSQEQLSLALVSIERKDKRSKLMQIADSYAYALASGGYNRKFDLYRRILERQRLVTSHVPGDLAGKIGVKYYCFDHKG